MLTRPDSCGGRWTLIPALAFQSVQPRCSLGRSERRLAADGHGLWLAGLRPPPPSVTVVLLVQSPGGHVRGHPGLGVQTHRATHTA